MPVFEKILVTPPFNADQKKALETASKGAKLTYMHESEIVAETLSDFDAIIGNIPPSSLKSATRLKWLQLASSGFDNYIAKGVLPRDTILTCATGAYGRAVAEHTFAMLLTLQKKLHLYRDNQNKGLWLDEGPVSTLRGATVLVVGLGDIGGEFAKLANALGAYTIGVRRTGGTSELAREVYSLDCLDKLLPRADVVMLCLPNTSETIGLIGKEQLRLMKKTAILLNAGRGGAIDSDALCDAVESSELFAAGLDVVDPEPLPAEHRIWRTRGILLTPHIAGGDHLSDIIEKIADISIKNLTLLNDGQQPCNIASATLGYAQNRGV